MAYKNEAGLGVYNQYGSRESGGSIGINGDEYSRIDIEFTGESLASGFLPPVVVPQGALFRSAVLRVNEAFVITGTSPTVIFGGTAPATNGIILTEAELEAVGTKAPASTGTGTWAQASATGTTASEKITKALGGTTPVVSATVGKAVLSLTFVYEKK